MPSDEYFKSKQFFDEMTENDETREKVGFIDFKHKTTMENIYELSYSRCSLVTKAEIFNIWTQTSFRYLFIEKMMNSLSFYEQVSYIKMLLRMMFQNGFQFDKYGLHSGHPVTDKEFVQIGFSILLSNKPDVLEHVPNSVFHKLYFTKRSMYYMDIRISNTFWNRFLIIPESHEDNMHFIYQENEKLQRRTGCRNVYNIEYIVDSKAYELDELADPSMEFSYKVDLLLKNTIYNHCEYY